MNRFLLLISSAALAGSTVELTLSAKLQSDFDHSYSLCRFYFCEDKAVTETAYTRQIEGTPASVQSAVAILLDVVKRDPASAQRWVDLEQALAVSGSNAAAKYSIDRALDLGHTSQDILVAAAEFYLRYGDRHEGLRYLSRALVMSPRFDQAIFSYFEARGVEMEDVLQYGLPPDKRAAQAYLRYLMGEGEVPNAEAVWGWMKARNLADRKLAVEYVDFLFNHKYPEGAANVWTGEFDQPGYRKTEFLFNGSFAREPIPGAVFDWQISPADHVEIAREADQRTGEWSLRIQFDGEANIDFANISQKVALQPGRYEFSAMLRTDGITTDEGVFVEIAGADAETEALKGTSGWRKVQAAFTVGSGARVVEVRVRRRASLRFDNKVKGTAWIERASIQVR